MNWKTVLAVLMLGAMVSGCVTIAPVEMKRADQGNNQNGNQGYIFGKSPKPLVDTGKNRTVIGVDVEVPPDAPFPDVGRETSYYPAQSGDPRQQ